MTRKGSPPRIKNANNQSTKAATNANCSRRGQFANRMTWVTRSHVTATDAMVGIRNSRNSVCGWK
jgi:hypothetical protein